MTFDQLNLSPALLTGLAKQGLDQATEIQNVAIEAVLSGQDVYIHSETGSGKTLAYLLPLYNALDLEIPATQVLIIAPTHELALQIHKVSCELAQNSGMAVRNLLLLGGTDLNRQLEKLKKKPQIVIGTLGRVLDLTLRGKLKLKNLKTLVIDEADRLLAGDSLEMMQKLISAAPKSRQLIFVSATEQPDSSMLIDQLSPDLLRLQVAEMPINDRIDHLYLLMEARDKPEMLRKLIHASQATKSVVFVHRNETAELVTSKLKHHKIHAADLHGAFEKEDRKIAMESFRSGKAQVLIASDLAARGLDIPGITHVFNLDLPTKAKDYLHRVGRTARATATGIAISLIIEEELPIIRRFQRELGIVMREIVLREGMMFEASGD